MAVDMVHIHHEGGGAPCTAAQCERFRHGGYCYGIGTDTFVRWLAPADNYATADWNGRDLTLCFSGDRHTGYNVSDHDLEVLHAAFMDSYKRGEVTANPAVVAHRNAGGSNATACPGDKTMQRWSQVAAACRADAPPTPEPPGDEMQPQCATAVNADGRPELFSLGTDNKITHRWRTSKGGTWSDWQPLGDGPYDSVDAFANPDGRLEVIAHNTTGGYMHCWQTTPNGGWSTWAPL